MHIKGLRRAVSKPKDCNMGFQVGTYRITLTMLDAGAAAMKRCRDDGVNTPHDACHAIFTAMLDAADSTPGADLGKSFKWSPHDRHRNPPKGRRVGKLTRADFDANGVREVVLPDGSVHRQLLQNFWYIKDK